MDGGIDGWMEGWLVSLKVNLPGLLLFLMTAAGFQENPTAVCAPVWLPLPSLASFPSIRAVKQLPAPLRVEN